MPAITPCLWFEDRAEEAATFWTSVFPRSAITRVTHYGPGMPLPEGTALTVEFHLDGQRYTALNAGPGFPFTQAVSLEVGCADQGEVDHYWTALTDGGQEGPCGWLTDRFGLSWQVNPDELAALMTDPDPARAQRATAAMMTMKKIDVAAIRAAADTAP